MSRQTTVKMALIASFGLIVATRHFCLAQEKDPRPEGRMKTRHLRRFEIAKKNFKLALEQLQQNPESTPSDIGYQWSMRWLQAQRDFSREPKQLRAIEEHMKRMKEWKETVESLAQDKKVGWDAEDSAEFFVLEAQEWLAQEKEKDSAQIHLIR